MTDTLTIREINIEALVAIFEAMRDGEPEADPYTITWSIVSRVDPAAHAYGKHYALGVVEAEERVLKVLTSTMQDKALDIDLIFRINVEPDVEAAKDLNRVLGELQRVIGDDPTLGGLVIDLRERGSNLDVEGVQDKQAEGVLFITMHYRVNERDPRSRV